MEKQNAKKLERLHSDNGKKLTSKESQQLCDDETITRYFIVRHTSQQNGVNERMDHTLFEPARCMLFDFGLSKDFWAEALNTIGYLINRWPATAIRLKILEDILLGKPTNYSTLRVFGCPTCYHIKDDKLKPQAKKGIFLVYASGLKGCRLWCPESQSFVIFQRCDPWWDRIAYFQQTKDVTQV